MDNDLLNYIRDARALDFNDEQIKVSLTQVGWDEDHIIKALSEANKLQPKTSIEIELDNKKEEVKPPITNKIIFIILIIILIFALFVAGYGIYQNFLIK